MGLSRLNFFNRLDARARVLVLLGAVVAFILIIYLAVRYFSGGATTGASKVAAPPQGLQSVPGATQTPEYAKAVEQANVQRSQQAQMTGTSAAPTQIYYGGQVSGCTVCPDQTANVKYNLDEWSRQGKITPDVATALQQLADANVPVNAYAAELDRLVKAGKLTPEQARALLEAYKKQHANALLAESAKVMDGMIKNGQLPLDGANALLTSQKIEVKPSDYADQLQQLVREGKISPAIAQQLLAQYAQQRAREIIAQSIATLRQMVSAGELLRDVEKELEELERSMVPFDAFSAAIQKHIQAGRLTPVIARNILAEYNAQKTAIGPTGTLSQILQAAEKAAYDEINNLVKNGQMSQEVGSQLIDMIQRNVPLKDYEAFITQLVQQKKMTPQIAQLKLSDYQKVKNLRDLAERLRNLQANNASPAAYADELKRAVQRGILSPEDAAALMREYQALMGPAPTPTPAAGTPEFARLQQQVAAGAPAAAVPAAEFAVAQTQAQVESAADRQARLQALMAAMSGQAQQLVAAWQPPTMAHTVGSPESKKHGEKGAPSEGSEKGTTEKGKQRQTGIEMAPIIKAGSILFAVLDTAVNSDYPDTPVLATIVAGEFKGAKLLGKLQTTKGVSGQLDRVTLNFIMMNMDAWPKSKSVTAYAIDPDTARTVLASSVNYHYLKKYGAMIATSFLQGYSTAITNAGTSTTGIFGTSTTHPELNPTSKIMVGLGQVGQNLGQVTQNWTNIPPTVKVDSGVGLGILFMQDIT